MQKSGGLDPDFAYDGKGKPTNGKKKTEEEELEELLNWGIAATGGNNIDNPNASLSFDDLVADGPENAKHLSPHWNEFDRNLPVEKPTQPFFDPAIHQGDNIPQGAYTEGPLAGLYIDEKGNAHEILPEDPTEIDLDKYPPETTQLYERIYAKVYQDERAKREKKKRKEEATHSLNSLGVGAKFAKRALDEIEQELKENPNDPSLIQKHSVALKKFQDRHIRWASAQPAEVTITWQDEEERSAKRILWAQHQKERMREYLQPLHSLVKDEPKPQVTALRLTGELEERLDGLTPQQKAEVLAGYQVDVERGITPSRPTAGMTFEERARDYYLVSTYFLKGINVRDISLLLNLPLKQVKKMLKRLGQEWMSSSLVNIDELRSRELARLAMVEAEAWLGWERSQEARTHDKVFYEYIRGVKIKRQAVSEIFSRSTGDSKYLKIIQDCIRMRSDLLGLYVTERTPNNQQVSITYVNDWRGSNVQVGLDRASGENAKVIPHMDPKQLPAATQEAQPYIDVVDYEKIARIEADGNS